MLKRGQLPVVAFLGDASSFVWSLGILGSAFDAGLAQMLVKSSILCFQNRRCEAVSFDCYNLQCCSFHEGCDNVSPGVIETSEVLLLEPAGGSGISEDVHGILRSFCGKPGTTKHTCSLARIGIWIDAL